MIDRTLGDADTAYLEAIADDCRRILGPGVHVDDLVVDQAGPGTTVTIRYRLDAVSGESVGQGDTVVEAHAALREALVIDRLRIGFEVVVDPPATP